MNIMTKRVSIYHIEIGLDGKYPFNGKKPSKYSVHVKQVIDFSKYKNTHQRISKILSIDDDIAIEIVNIVESYLHKNYTILYEYIPYKITNKYEQLHDYFINQHYHDPLFKFFKNLLQIGIKPKLHIDDFGFSLDMKLKIYVNPNFDIVECSDPIILQKTALQLVSCCDKIFQSELSQSINSKIKNKFLYISEKMKKLNPGQFLKEHLKKESIKQSFSQKSNSLPKSGEHFQKIGNAHWNFDNDFNFEDSFNQKDNKKDQMKRSFSLKDGDKKEKQHQHRQKKPSCGDSNTSNVQSVKTTVLKKKVSQALLKTQRTLTKYERIRSKTPKKNVLYTSPSDLILTVIPKN